MSTITFDDARVKPRRAVMISVPHFFRALKRTIMGEKTTCTELPGYKKAVRSLRLAAEPGEAYPAVADRIDREVAIYRDFLMRPRPIGKISLIVKELDPDSPDFRSPRKQYQVHEPSEGKRDPAEGLASVKYRFNRSATKVLEFMVHDAKDAPLFAVARTYSTWLGNKEFPLGHKRVFYLNMVEDSPGYVMVHAGFRPASEEEYATEKPTTIKVVPPMPQPVIDGPEQESRNPILWSLPQSRLAYLFGFQCAVISLFCGGVLWLATGSAMSRTVAHQASVPSAAAPSTSSTDASRLLSTFAGGSIIRPDDTRVQGGKNIRIKLVQKAKRLARVNGFSVSIKDDSCKSKESRCLELLTTIQKEVASSLSSLRVPVYTPGQIKKGIEPAELVVSYKPVDLIHGQIHLTLYDQQGELWRDRGDLNYAGVIEPAAVTTYCEEASTDMIWEIITAKTHVNSIDEKGEVTTKSK